METADLKIAISALFIVSLSPFLPSRAILAMTLSIDCFGRSARSIVLKSALWYVASYYLVIMLRVDFLFSRHGTEETTAQVAFDAANTPEMIRFPCGDYQHARQLCLTTFPRIVFRRYRRRNVSTFCSILMMSRKHFFYKKFLYIS